MFNIDKGLEKHGYKFEFEYGDYNYSWDITRVYSRDDHVFNLSTSGCSCYDFDDMFDNIDTAIGDMHEVPRLPSMDALGDYDETAEAIQAKYRALGLH